MAIRRALLRGWQRGLGAGLAGFAFGLAAIACEMVESAFGVALPDLLTGVLFAVMLALLLTVLAIMLLNRPKFLVPPRFRSEPGVLSDWFGSRHRR